MAIIREVIGTFGKGNLNAPKELVEEDTVYYKEYNQTLIRKLEDKMLALKRANRRLASLYEASNKLMNLHPIGELALTALHTIVDTAGYQEANYFAYDEVDRKFRIQDSVGVTISPDIKKLLTFEMGEARGLIGLVGETRQPLIIPDVTQDPRWIKTEEKIRSILFVPVLHGNQLLGVASLASDQVDDFQEEDTKNITALVNNLAIAIDRARLYGEVQKSELFFRTILETSADAIIHTDPDINITLWNRGAQNIFGYTKDEVIGKPFKILLPPGAKLLVDEQMTRLRDQGYATNLETQRVTKDGRILDVEITLTDLGPEIGYTAIMRDITKRKEASEALLESERRFRILAEFTHDWEYWVGLDNEYIYISPACESLTGYSAEEFQARPELLLEITHPDHRQKVRNHYLKEDKATTLHASFEFPITHREGHEVWIAHQCKPIFGKQGEFLGRRGNNRNITTRKNAEEQVQIQFQRLAALNTIDRAIICGTELKMVLKIFLEQTIQQLGVDAADILLYNENLLELDFVAGHGFQTKALQHTKLRIGQGLAGRAALERKMVDIPDLHEVSGLFSDSQHLKEEHFVSYFGVPLIAKGLVMGVLEIFHRSSLKPDAEWMDYLNTLAGQAAIAISNIQLFTSLQKANVEINHAYDSTLEGWSRALELRDRETDGHSRRVVDLTLDLAKKLGITNGALTSVRRGALLHDIGKMGVPDRVLLKPGPLTESEWELMRQHPTFAYNLLSPIGYLREALDIPYCHHEKWDGTGYPRGLKGEQIPLSARIFAVIDVWDALRAERPYRKAWSEQKAFAYIEEQAGSHFDPKVVEAFIKMITESKS